MHHLIGVKLCVKMKRKKKFKFNWLILVIIVFAIFLLGYLKIINLPFAIGDSINISSGTLPTGVPFSCNQQGVSSCSVIGKVTCNKLIDTVECTTCETNHPINVVQDWLTYLRSTYGVDKVRECSCNPNNKCWEACWGDRGYSCSGNVKINGNTVQTLSCQDDSICSQTYSTALNPGDTMSIIGGDENSIKFTAYRISECDFSKCEGNSIKKCVDHKFAGTPTQCESGYECMGGLNSNATCQFIPQCSVDQCNQQFSGYYKCINGHLESTINSCDISAGFKCVDYPSGAKCDPPFSTKTLRSSKTGYTENETIILSVNLVSDRADVTTGSVNLYLWKPGEKVSGPYQLTNFNFKDNVIRTVQIPNPKEVGVRYFATMEIIYNGKTVTLTDFPASEFTISPQIGCTIDVSSPGRTTLYVNNPVYVDINVQSLGRPTEVDKITPTIKFNSVPVSIDPNSYQKPPIVTGSSTSGVLVYRYVTQFATAGNLEANAVIEKYGLQSSCTMPSKEVKSVSLDVKFDNMPSCVLPTGSNTFKIKSVDSYDNPASATITLMVTDPGQTEPKDISNLVQNVNTGEYTFNYDLNLIGESANYRFTVKGTSTEFNVGSQPYSRDVEVKSNCVPEECSQTSDCLSKGTEYMCLNGKCVKKDNPLILFFIILGAFIVITLIIVIVYFYRKKQSSPEINLGGL